MIREANFENRIYFFQILKNEKDEVRVTMYSTEYTFKREGEKWVNAGNKMNMNPELIAEVIKVVKGNI